MLPILDALAPVFLVIVLGFGLHRARLLSEATWPAIEYLCYYVLFPALIVRTLATTDFAALDLGGLVLGFLLALVAATGLLIASKPLLCRALDLSDAAFTSLFQSATRWHGFVALAIVSALYGAPGVAVVAVGLAALVPALNVINVLVLIRWGDRSTAGRPPVLRQLARNPFILACAGGALLNATGAGLPEPLFGAAGYLSGGALGLSLISIGAGLRPLEAYGKAGALLTGLVFRLVLMPVVFFLALTMCGVDGPARTYAVICGGVPTAASAYVLARQMGGDAPLMASMITAQIITAALTLPMVIYVLQRLEG